MLLAITGDAEAQVVKKKKKSTSSKSKKKKQKLSPRQQRFMLLGLLGLAIILCLYFFFSPLSMVNSQLFHPTKAASYPDIPDDLLGAKREDVSFKTPAGVKLHGILFEMPGAKYTFLLNHGWGGNLSTHMGLVKTVLLNGQSILTYDYEGYGISDGVPSVAGLVEDGAAAFDFLTNEKGIKPDRIVLYGASLGSGVAGTVAMIKPPAGVMLVCPYTSLKRLARETLPYLNLYPDFLFPQPDIGSETFLHYNAVTPVMIVHGVEDRIISVQHSKDLNAIRPYKTTLVLEKDKHHGDFSTPVLAKHVCEFLNILNGGKYETRECQEEVIKIH